MNVIKHQILLEILHLSTSLWNGMTTRKRTCMCLCLCMRVYMCVCVFAPSSVVLTEWEQLWNDHSHYHFAPFNFDMHCIELRQRWHTFLPLRPCWEGTGFERRLDSEKTIHSGHAQNTGTKEGIAATFNKARHRRQQGTCETHERITQISHFSIFSKNQIWISL